MIELSKRIGSEARRADARVDERSEAPLVLYMS